MFVTEEQAHTKWCPEARATVQMGSEGAIVMGSNRIGCEDTKLSQKLQKAIDNAGFTRCLASGCMAWRRGLANAQMDDGSWVTTGYCGLAGKPEV